MKGYEVIEWMREHGWQDGAILNEIVFRLDDDTLTEVMGAIKMDIEDGNL